jgi:hypothetical protein
LDQEVREQVVEKYEHIQKLRLSEFEYVKGEAATRDNIKRYMDKILEMPNVDLDYQLRIAMQKLSILRISQQMLQGNLKENLQKLSQMSSQGGYLSF